MCASLGAAHDRSGICASYPTDAATHIEISGDDQNHATITRPALGGGVVCDRLELAVPYRRHARRVDTVSSQHPHHTASPRCGQLPVSRVLRRVDGQVIGEAFDVNRIIERCQNPGDLFQEIERVVVGQRIATGEQQARIQLDFHPQLITANGQLIGTDKIGESRLHALHDALQRIDWLLR